MSSGWGATCALGSRFGPNAKGLQSLESKDENGQLVEKEIVCPTCGGQGAKFIELHGSSCAILTCTECRERLAEFSTLTEMEKRLQEAWGWFNRTWCGYRQKRISPNARGYHIFLTQPAGAIPREARRPGQHESREPPA